MAFYAIGMSKERGGGQPAFSFRGRPFSLSAMNPQERAQVWAACGATAAEVEELLAYGESRFDLAPLERELTLPLPDEPFVAFWEERAAEAAVRGAVAALRPHLPQLRFPLGEGMSRSPGYQSATRRGEGVGEADGATGLELAAPESVTLELYPTPAGRIPLLVVRDRETFVALLCALAHRNEPVPVAPAQGASMIAGYNNWSRLGELKRRWQELPVGERETASWGEEMARIKPRTGLYQDRFILLSDGPYSGIPAADLGLPDGEWRELSLAIRRDHECAHYFTRRLLGSMRNHALDELIADAAGLLGATGRFRAGWFLRFLGLEAAPDLRPGGRLALYRGDPPLGDGAFRVLGALLARAAEQVERFDETRGRRADPVHDRALLMATLASCRLEEIAAESGPERLERIWRELDGRVCWQAPPRDPAGP
jgi:hypothetical protein